MAPATARRDPGSRSIAVASPMSRPPLEAPVDQGTEPPPPSSPLRWSFAVGGVLLLELLFLLGSFSIASLPAERQGWMVWMDEVDVVPRIALVLATAFLLFLRTAAEPALPPRPAPPRSPRRLAVPAALQLASYASLYLLSEQIFDRHLAGRAQPELWIALWLASAASTAGFAVLLCCPFHVVLGWIQRNAALWFGIAFLGLAAWSAGAWLAQELAQTLRTPTLWGTSLLLQLLGEEVRVEESAFLIHVGSISVSIALECSGFEGLGLALAFTSAYLAVFRRELRFPQVLLLPPLAALVAWLVNVARIAVLVQLAANGWSSLAVAGFHSVAGTLAFCALALGIVALSRRLRFFALGAAEPRPLFVAARGDSTAAHLVPFLLGVAVGMIARAFQERLPSIDLVRLLLVVGALVYFRREYHWRPRISLGLPLLCGTAAAAIWLALPTLLGIGDAREVRVPEGGWTPLGFAARHLGYLLVFPLAEELAFRQYLMRRLTHLNWFAIEPRQVTMLAWFLSSAAFGLLHGQWAAATIAGALYGLLYLRRGSLAEVFLAHALTNTLLVAATYGSDLL
jgi:exosortase E/protease (VPEID-CTERM system)